MDALPLGSLLNFPGHQMMYLGKQAGQYYVVSTVSSLMSPYSGETPTDPLLPDQYVGHQTCKRENLDIRAEPNFHSLG